MADELQSVIPVLSKGTEDLLESKESKLWHILSYSLLNPGFTSDINGPEVLSFRELEAKFGNNKDALKEQYKQGLMSVVSRHYPNEGITALVEIEDIAENTFTLQVGFLDKNSNPILTTKPITIDPNQIDLNLNVIAK